MYVALLDVLPLTGMLSIGVASLLLKNGVLDR